MTATTRARPARLAAMGVALVVLGLVAGCVRIPTTSEVSTAQIAIDGDRDELLPVPEGPVAGASAREIVAGFLRAGRGPQSGYGVAAQYLAESFRSQWRPTAGVLVSSSPLTPVETPTGFRVELEVAAEVDSGGRYQLAGAGASRSLDFELVQEGGEWRISAAPDGTVLTPTFFERLFEPVSLYYYSPDFRFLVPELRWFLDSRAIANRIVDELLAGGSPLLESDVLLTAFPTGTSRLERSVEIDAGRATVTLSSEILAESRPAQWRMLQQLTASVGSLSDVRSVQIVSGGLPVAIDESGETADRAPQVEPIPVGVLDGAFGTIGEEEVRELDEPGDAVDGLGARAASLSRDRTTVAVLTAEGVSRVTSAGAVPVLPGEDLVAPSIDPWGYIWTTPRDHLDELVAVAPDGRVLPVGLGLDGRVEAVSVSRDGTRVLLAVATGDGPRVVVAGVVRGQDEAPTALVESSLLATGADELLDAAWVDGTTIALLERRGGATSVTTAMIGGRLTSLGTVDDAVQLVGGNGVEGIRVRTSAGAVFRPSGDASWLDTGLHASFLAVQQ